MPSDASATVIDYSEMRRLFSEHQVLSFQIKDGTITLELMSNYKDSDSPLVKNDLLSL